MGSADPKRQASASSNFSTPTILVKPVVSVIAFKFSGKSLRTISFKVR